MTARIIHHNFRQEADTACITEKALEKGNRIIKMADNVNTALNTACIFLCGVCTTISALVFLIWVLCP